MNKEHYVKHINAEFYRHAKNFHEEIRVGQIEKGAEKYPEPYNPDNYTIEEQITHFMQENVDQSHYAYGLYLTCKKLQEENEELKHRLASLEK